MSTASSESTCCSGALRAHHKRSRPMPRRTAAAVSRPTRWPAWCSRGSSRSATAPRWWSCWSSCRRGCSATWTQSSTPPSRRCRRAAPCLCEAAALASRRRGATGLRQARHAHHVCAAVAAGALAGSRAVMGRPVRAGCAAPLPAAATAAVTGAARRRACVQVSVLRYYLVHAIQAGKMVSTCDMHRASPCNYACRWHRVFAIKPLCGHRAPLSSPAPSFSERWCCSGQGVVRDFLAQHGDALLAGPSADEWGAWFALPFLRSPASDPRFQARRRHPALAPQSLSRPPSEAARPCRPSCAASPAIGALSGAEPALAAMAPCALAPPRRTCFTGDRSSSD